MEVRWIVRSFEPCVNEQVRPRDRRKADRARENVEHERRVRERAGRRERASRHGRHMTFAAAAIVRRFHAGTVAVLFRAARHDTDRGRDGSHVTNRDHECNEPRDGDATTQAMALHVFMLHRETFDTDDASG
jgi:hypothetical protein